MNVESLMSVGKHMDNEYTCDIILISFHSLTPFILFVLNKQI